MLSYDGSPTPRSDLNAAARGDPATLRDPLSRSIRSHPSHERAALANALDDGLMPDEVARILAGRRVAEAFPIRWGESPEAYASRAVAEMFVAYLQ
ncbi:hypothetical protein MKK75_10820 [Methylobacterium sp. J-030]|uniref:hypothetical protein n=1 Tax=Methylobacterium sp. J-030 TaxID=2836627 RepID=UPI001FBC0300|nr:hypothetical protein [Methylobacterium sp. J-030]MCJ2069285.1 hypothetical protein [Methylobacterium sp. J-030]